MAQAETIAKEVAKALAALGIAPNGAPAVEAPKANGAETKEQREAKKLALAKALPASLDVAGQSAPLTFTGSRKGKEFTIHAVVSGVKVRINGYVMPE